MANPNAPFGFKPLAQMSGGAIRNAGDYFIPSAYGTSLFSGDLVRSVANQNRQIERAPSGAATRVLGVFQGCQYVDVAGNIVFAPIWLASTALLSGTLAKAVVYDDPALEFIAQMTTYAITDYADGFDFAIGTGSAVTGKSAAQIDAAGTANDNVRVLGLSYKPSSGDVSELGAFAVVRCRISAPERGAGIVAAEF